MTFSETMTLLGIFATIIIAVLGAIWTELLKIRKRLHKLEGVGTFAVEVLGKYRLMRREDRDPVLDNGLDKLRKEP